MARRIGPPLTAEMARSLLRYDRKTGWLIWRVDIERGKGAMFRCKGRRAGSLEIQKGTGHRRRTIRIQGRNYTEHNVIWLMETGAWPEIELDHENTDGADNRWTNLRESTRAQNCQNRRCRSDSTTGLKGVSVTKRGKFQARIVATLGTFDTPEQAHAAYAAAAKALHGAFLNLKGQRVSASGKGASR